MHVVSEGGLEPPWTRIFPDPALEYAGGGEIPCSGISCGHASGRALARVKQNPPGPSPHGALARARATPDGGSPAEGTAGRAGWSLPGPGHHARAGQVALQAAAKRVSDLPGGVPGWAQVTRLRSAPARQFPQLLPGPVNEEMSRAASGLPQPPAAGRRPGCRAGRMLGCLRPCRHLRSVAGMLIEACQSVTATSGRG